MKIKLILLLAVAFCLTSTEARAQVYAITNARIVTVAGPTIEKGTIVMRNGLIDAVGANVSAPADATIIDGNGLTVYPGFIDALTSLGIQAQQPQPTGGRGGGGGGPQAQPAANSATSNSNYPAG